MPANDVALVRWGIAATLACAGYYAAVHLELPAFYYYPMAGQWHLSVPAAAETLGPRITYYGWKVSGLALMPLAWLVPAAICERMPQSSGFWGAVLAIAVMLANESRWFLM